MPMYLVTTLPSTLLTSSAKAQGPVLAAFGYNLPLIRFL
jgi:hypothetical protein